MILGGLIGLAITTAFAIPGFILISAGYPVGGICITLLPTVIGMVHWRRLTGRRKRAAIAPNVRAELDQTPEWWDQQFRELNREHTITESFVDARPPANHGTDYFEATLALDPTTGNVVPHAEAQIHAISDRAFTTPLQITDIAGTPLPRLLASSTGIYPPFRVATGETCVVAKSRTSTTPLTSIEGTQQPRSPNRLPPY